MDHSKHFAKGGNSLLDLFANLMPHNHCFLWAEALIPFFFAFNFLIFLAYTFISVVLTTVWIKRKDNKHVSVFLLYAAFIFFCGLCHLLAGANLWTGWYIAETYLLGLTALVSIAAAVKTAMLAPFLLRVPKIDHLKEAVRLSKVIFNKEKQLEAVLDLATSGYWEWDVVTGYDWMSESWHTMLGYTVGELEYRVETWESLMHPDDLPLAKKAMQKHWDSKGEIPYILNARYLHKNGHWVKMKDVGRVTEWSKDWKPLRMIGYEKLITERGKNV